MKTNVKKIEFDTPLSIDDATERAEEVLETIEDIKLQLGIRRHTKDVEWRKKALTALRINLKEYRYLKNWTRRRRMTSALHTSADEIKDDTLSLLKKSFDLTTELTRDGVELSNDEKMLLSKVSHHLENN